MASASSNLHGKLSLRHKIGATVTPGERLGLIVTRHKVTLVSGKGTYVRQGHLYASLLGTLCALRCNDDNDATSCMENKESEMWVISITPESSSLNKSKWSPWSYSTNASAFCPKVGMLVLGRITRVVRPSQAVVDIVAIIPDVNSRNISSLGSAQHDPSIRQLIPLHEPFAGTLRQGDLRPNAALEVRIEECVRPGDVVLARVLADGDRDFILTTEAAELGVVRATCESSGRVMRAVSWKEMECPVTGMREGRKVAKPRRMR